MALTANQAIQRLLDNPAAFSTEESLLGLVNQLSVEATGKVTVLYSGSLGQDAFGKSVSAGAVVENLVERGADIRVIDKTEAAKFIKSRDFEQAVERVTGSSIETPNSAANDFLYNAKGGAWAKASENFIKATSGEVITWTPNARGDRVFAQTEIPAALADNSKITAINGRSVDGWRAEYKLAGAGDEALTKIANGLNASSAELLLDSNMRIVTGGGGSVVGVDTGNFFQKWGASAPTGWLPAGSGESLNAMVAKGSDASRWSLWEQGRELVKKIDDIPGAHAAGNVAKKGLPFLGLALGAIDANAAYEQGDVEGAKRIMSDAAAEALLGLAGDVAIGTLVATGSVALGLGGLAAGAIGITAGVLTGVITSEATNRMMGYARQALADRGIDLGIGAPAPVKPPAQNPTIFDLSTDTQNNRPQTPAIGTTTDRVGLLGGSGSHRYGMPEAFVNLGGLSNTSASALATGQTRPGNVSRHALDDQIKGLRVGVHTSNQPSNPTAPPPSANSAPNSIQVYDSTLKQYTEVNGTPRLNESGEQIGFKSSSGEDYMLEAFVTYNRSTGQETSGLRWVPIDSDNTAGLLRHQQQFNNPNITTDTDPLSLDAGGDGIRMSASPVSFDLDANGSAEAVLWTAPTDPLLVLDTNRDGRINNGSELVDLAGKRTHINLFTLDSNADQRLNALDTAFPQLQIWQDRNQDGHASPGELQGLAELGIVSIDLAPGNVLTGNVAGQANVKGVNAQYTDGSVRTLWDVSLPELPAATLNSRNQHSASIDMITAYGQAALQAMSHLGVNIALDGSGANQAIGAAGNDTLTGTTADDWLVGHGGADQFQGGAGRDLLIIDADDRPSDIDGGSDIDTVLIADDRAVLLNLARSNVEVVYGGYGNDVLLGGGADNYFIDGAAGNDAIDGGSADDALNGGDGQDVIAGHSGDDLIRGGRDKDLLRGGLGGDVLNGGQGDDTLYGDEGNDVFLESEGFDVIDGGQGIDLVELSGELHEYKFSKTSDGYQIRRASTDTTLDIKGVERFSFHLNGTPINFTLGMDNPIPVNDTLAFDSLYLNFDGKYLIPTTKLVGNDIDFQNLANPGLHLHWAGDAVGGTVEKAYLRGVFVGYWFKPTEGYTGPMGFNYRVRDGESPLFSNKGPTIAWSSDQSLQGEMTAHVSLVPTKAAAQDPEFEKQWYLGASRITEAWKDGYTGKGVTALILEPSGEFARQAQVANLDHPDLIANKKATHVASAVHSEHATAVASVLGAARNGMGGVGVAHEVTLDARSTDHGPDTTLAEYEQNLSHMSAYDVVNNSWAYTTFWPTLEYAISEALTQKAIISAAQNGRGGSGTIVVNGAGNNRAGGGDSNLSSLGNNAHSITVGAINKLGDIGQGTVAVEAFSSRGANILVSAFGSQINAIGQGFESPDGDQVGKTTLTTQGTSFAAPIVSGVVSLMLQANKNLTYRDVQEILAATAKMSMGTGANFDTQWHVNADRNWNGVGRHFSHDHGFGAVDALAAVRMAENWTSNAALQTTTTYAENTVSVEGTTGKGVFSFHLENDHATEHAIVSLNLRHERWSDLVVTLVSPSGTRSVLLNEAGTVNGTVQNAQTQGETALAVDLMSTHFRGEPTKGTWKLEVQDVRAGASFLGEIDAKLQLTGTQTGVTQRLIATDEYAGGGVFIASGSHVEFNASAVTEGNVQIDLSHPGSAWINGKTATITGKVDKLIGSGNNDILTGTSSDETIVGARGNDTIRGENGKDTLLGSQGDDELHGGEGHDSLDGGDGNDILHGEAGSDVLLAGTGNDTLVGGSGGDAFVIDAPNSGQITIRDFVASEGDFIVIRTPDGRPVELSQTLNADNRTLSVSFLFDQEGQSKTVQINVLNVDRPLDLSQNEIIFKPLHEEVSINAGGLPAKHMAATAEPIWVREIKGPTPIRRGMDPDSYDPLYEVNRRTNPAAYKAAINLLRSQGTVVFSVAAGAAKVNPGERIAIVDTLSNDGFRYRILEWGVLEATWDGLKASTSSPSGVELRLLVQARYSNDGKPTDASHAAWSVAGNKSNILEGSHGADSLQVLVPAENRPWDVDVDRWNASLSRLPTLTLLGQTGNDSLIGSYFSELMDGGGDDDSLNGNGGDDTLMGGIGDDVLFGGTGNDSLTGGEGKDTFRFAMDSGNDRIADLSKDDIVHLENTGWTTGFSYYSANPDGFVMDRRFQHGTTSRVDASLHIGVEELKSQSHLLHKQRLGEGPVEDMMLRGDSISELGDLIIQHQLNSSWIDALGGSDLIYSPNNAGLHINGGDGQDSIFALTGENEIHGGQGNDVIHAYEAFTQGTTGDQLWGDEGNDNLTGAALNDTLYGGSGDDTLSGGGGSDHMDGGIGRDRLNGGDGADTLLGGNDADTLEGGRGNDELYGDSGNDVMIDTHGDDLLDGGEGDDLIVNGHGNDTMIGGAGDDEFQMAHGDGVPDTVIVDQTSGHDIIVGLAGNDTLRFNDMLNTPAFSLKQNGAQVTLSWGTNSVSLYKYSLSTFIEIHRTNGEVFSGRLMDIFKYNGYNPDGSFEFLNGKDLQTEGNKALSIVKEGSDSDDELETIPNNAQEAAFSYILGRGGDDKIAGGASGALVDPGSGANLVLVTTDLTLTKDTRQPGKTSLVFQPGVTADQLRFTRVLNPASWAMDPAATSSTPKPRTGYTKPSPLINPFDGTTLESDPAVFSIPGPNGYYAADLEFDTLRVETLNGRYKVDIVGYFSSTSPNTIDEFIFTTEFDDGGNSKRYLAKDLVEDPRLARTHRFIDNDRFDDLLSSHASTRIPSLKNESARYQGNSYNKGINTTQDGESGKLLAGTISWMVGKWYPYENGRLYSGNSIYTSPYLRTTTATDYQRFKGEMLYPDQVLKYEQDYSDYQNQAPIWTNKNQAILNTPLSTLDIPTDTKDPLLHAFSRVDIIFGNGGNDTIQAGGVYFEELDLATGAMTRTNPYGLSRETITPRGDSVNGGAGDDTYVYKKWDGILTIFSDESETGGASGIDRLDLRDYRYSDVFKTGAEPAISATGAMQIKLPGEPYFYSYINIEEGALGEIQIDYIDFSDRSVSVRDLMTVHAATYKSDRELGVAYIPRQSTSLDFSDLAPTVSGSPGMDKILVSENKYYTGHEGEDFYVIDPDVIFAVVQMDTGDLILQPDDDYIPAGAWVLDGQPADATYLGRTSAQWMDAGVLPYGAESSLRENYSFADYYPVSTLVSNISFQGFEGFLSSENSFEFGTFNKSATNEPFSLANWTPLSGEHERFLDVKISWFSNANGVKTEHTLIALDAVPADGLRTSGVNEWLQLYWGIGTSGDDSGSLAYGREGNDNILASGEAYGGSGNDTVNAAAAGSASILHGDAGNDHLIGSSSGDTLDGGAGADILSGGLGDDVYMVDELDTIEDSGGFDEIITFNDFALSDSVSVEKISAAGQAPIHVSGNKYDNTLASNGHGNVLQGGNGNDNYIVLSGSDQVIEHAGEGVDGILTSIQTFLLPEHVENLKSIGLSSNLVGNRLGNDIIGDAGSNHIDGQSGGDTMRGLEGDDTYYVDNINDMVIEERDAGMDTVIYKNPLASHGAIENVEKFVVSSTGDFVIHGNDLSNTIVGGHGYDEVFAGNGADLILTNGGNDTVHGEQGDDTLDGGQGTDVLIGGAGNDTYVIDSIDDVITEIAGEGESDAVRVQFSGSYDLSNTNIENIVAEGGQILATGNASNNHIVGSTNDDSLYGMSGNDTLVSGGGYDRLYGGEGQDTYEVDLLTTTGVEISAYERNGDTLIIKGVASTSDLVFHRVEVTLYAEDSRPLFERVAGNHLEIGLLGSNGQSIVVYDYFNADGSNSGALSNIRVGNTTLTVDDIKAALPKATAGDDALYGFSVAESISGLNGNDVIDGAGGADTLSGGKGNDVIYGAGHLEGGDDSDRLFLREWLSISGSTLSGGNGDDTLDSYNYGYMRPQNSETSVLDGGTGNDTYLLHKFDRALHRAGEGVDVVKSHAYAGSNELRMEGLKLSELVLARTPGANNLVVATKSGVQSDQVTVEGYFSKSTSNRLKLSVLNDAGTGYVVLSDSTIASMSNTGNGLNNLINGTSNGESLSGFGGDDVINGQNGNDTLIGGEGNDVLNDSTGTDRFEGGSGDDSLRGGGGGDTYDGGVGNDTYWAQASSGAGNLTIIDTDTTAGNQDALILDTNPYSLLFKQVGNDLLVTRMDAGNSLTVKDWFSGTSHQVESIQTSASDGHYSWVEGQLSNTSIQQLVQAMANFAPAAGQTQVSEQNNSALFQTIQNVWGVQTHYSD